jgi:peptidyl-prolyl cis-trans isomerase C
LPQEMVVSLVKDIYAQKKLDEKIKKSNLIKRADIKAEIDNYAKKITRNQYLDEAIKNKVNEQSVKDKYSELVNDLNGKKEVHLRHILVKTKVEAENIIKQIKDKKSFSELAVKYSIDDTTAKEGGDLGYIFEDNLIPEFSDFVASMKKGDVSSPIDTKYGWHIVKIEDLRNAEAPPFESVKSAVEEQLKKDEIHKVFSGLADNAKVKILINLESSDNHNSAKSPKLLAPELIQDKE